MSLLSKFTVKPLLYVIAGLLLVVVGLSIQLALNNSRLKVAQAATATAVAQQSQTATEREAWKARAVEVGVANHGWQEAVATLQAELAAAQTDLRTLDKQSQQAIARARADAAEADRVLKTFLGKYQVQARAADCARALQTVEAACPAFTGY